VENARQKMHQIKKDADDFFGVKDFLVWRTTLDVIATNKLRRQIPE
jgi:hypothetical protein